MRASGRKKKEPQGSFFYCRGFSLTELIAILVVVGIISVFATSRIGTGSANVRSCYDQLLSQVQYARKVAIAQRRAIFVRIDAAQSRLCYSAAGACTTNDAVAGPGGDVPFRVGFPAGVAVAPGVAVFQFDSLGRYRTAAGGATATPNVVSVTGEGGLQFSIEHDTGYVRGT